MFHEQLNWFVQNALPFVIGILVGTILDVLFREFLYNEFISPSFRHQIKVIKNKIKKKLHNTSFDLSYTSTTVGLDAKNISNEKIHEITKYLQQRRISVSEVGDIVITEYKVDNIIYAGKIEFSISRGTIDTLQGFDITLTTEVRYNSMDDDITTLIQSVNKLKEYVALALNTPIEYKDTMFCNLKKLMLELSEAMKDLDIEFIKFGGRADVSVTKDKIVFREPIIPSIIFPNLRKLVTLYG